MDGGGARPSDVLGQQAAGLAASGMSLAETPEPQDDAVLSEALAGADGAREVAHFMKAFAHEGRLMILCHLAEGERSVGQLEELLNARQSAVSQQLARLRLEGLVRFRREGKTLYYSLADDRARRMLRLLRDLFRDVEDDDRG